MSESPETDSERITSTPSMPLSRSASSGTVIISSTSLAESPNASVWTSTYGGVNSGRTSTGAFRSCTIPTAITPTAIPMIKTLKRRLVPMIERIIADNLPAQMLSRCHSTLKNRSTKGGPCHLLPVGVSRESLLKRRRAAASCTFTGDAQPSHSPLIESEHFQTPKLVGRTPLRVHDARSRKLQWMTYWRMFSSRSFGAESAKNILLISSSRTSRVGSYLLGTRTLLFTVFRSGIAPVLRGAKRGDPYRRKTPKKGRSSQAPANDEPTTPEEHNASCL